LGWGTTPAERAASLRQEIEGIKQKLLPLPADTRVYPGHEDGTTIGAERTHNPFLNPGGSDPVMSKVETPDDH
jgi:glyoxylase-like metal-dependent hydrolase (beta-lactamase superfamily II)